MFRALEPLIYLHLCFFFNANLYSNVNLYLNVVRSAEFHCLNVAPALKMPSLPSHSSSQLCLPPSLTVFVFLYFFNFDRRQLYLLPSQTVFAFLFSCISYFFAALPARDWKSVCLCQHQYHFAFVSAFLVKVRSTFSDQLPFPCSNFLFFVKASIKIPMHIHFFQWFHVFVFVFAFNILNNRKVTRCPDKV